MLATNRLGRQSALQTWTCASCHLLCGQVPPLQQQQQLTRLICVTVEPGNTADAYMLPDFLQRAAAAATAQGHTLCKDMTEDPTTFTKLEFGKLERGGLCKDAMRLLLALIFQGSEDDCRKVPHSLSDC